MIRCVIFFAIVVAAAGREPCARCHPKQAESFAGSPMGRSVSAPHSGEAAVFTHSASGSRFAVRFEGQTLLQRLERHGIVSEYPIAFAIGSGNHGQGYLVREAGKLFQSPVAWYRSGGKWDVAPGYEQMTAPDFNRRVTSECLLCHTAGGEEEARSITCERCHGDSEQHLRRPSRANIVNPARLARDERDSVCEQCHLNGEARVLNPGEDFAAFRPGRRVEDFFSVFVYDRPGGGLKVVSHAEQLALSACQRQTGRLWCGTCHQPHGEKTDVTARCRECHSTLPSQHPASTSACTVCHMPKRPAKDGGHSAFTDHRIQRRPEESGGDGRPTALRAWRSPADTALARRNLGLAYVMTAERDGTAEFFNRGYGLLAGIYPRFPKDPDVLSSLGMVLFLKDQKANAVKLQQAAVALRPKDSRLYEKLAVIRRSLGENGQAAAALEKAIALDPTRETAYHLLAELQPTAALRQAVLERYLRIVPRSVIAREAIAKLPGR